MKKGKTSRVKHVNIKQNKLTKQGKLKKKKHQKMVTKFQATNEKEICKAKEMDDDSEELFKMADRDDWDFLNKAVANQSYSLYGEAFKKLKNQKRKIGDDYDSEEIEDQYEKNYQTEVPNKRIRHLLPLKTVDGVVRRTVEEDIKEESGDEEEKTIQDIKGENVSEDEFQVNSIPDKSLYRPITTAEVLALRERTLSQYKLRIGHLSSTLLEDPPAKVKNISLLLEMLNESRPELQITVKKLVMLSLTEVFKDILPSYQIKHQEDSTIKLKKDTKQLQEYEKSLLKGYKLFLTKVEKILSILYKKRGDARHKPEQLIKLGELALRCLCDLLVTHPYFNFSVNLVQLLIPYLDNSAPSVRRIVHDAVVSLFKTDKKGEITLIVMRRINHLVKSRSHSVHNEVVSVMLYLNIKNVNLDREKEIELKQKKFMTYKQKLLKMSKKERKRSKKLEELEKELMETKAEENKQTKQKYLTEVMKVLFTIYFRILKTAPSSKVLSTALEGLAKFAHCINLEFYHDLVNVLDNLMLRGTLKYREQLHCVETVFAILSGHGEVLNIDPLRFYTHLYKNLYYIHAGRSHQDIQIALRVLETVLVQRHKRITQQRLLAFTKRLAILACHLIHNGALGCLGLVKRVMQLGKQVDVLLDVDASVGQGIYNPELEEPEHCNAGSTALWELTALERHYHPTVRQFAHHLASNSTVTLPIEIAKLNGIKLFSAYDPSQVVFHPSVPVSPAIAMDRKVRPTPPKCSDPGLAYLENKINKIKMSANFKCLYQKKTILGSTSDRRPV